MTKIFITGSTNGLGFLAAQQLIKEGNEVVLHARNQKRADEVLKRLPKVKHVVIGDLSRRKEVESMAEQVNALGVFDTVIYNAGIDSTDTDLTFRVNDLAPYLLTALIKTPKRVIYISSGMHVGARLDITNLAQTTDYSSSKLQLVLLTKALTRLNSDIVVTAVDPGWVPTKMGGRMATDDLTEGYMTQVWLATLEDKSVSGDYFHHKKLSRYDQRADDEHLQNAYLQELASITKVKI